MKYITLNNSLKIPQLGFGVWQIPDEVVMETIASAIEVGYRSFDNATLYGNERGVGGALTKSNLSREELFVTTKVWNDDHGYENTLNSFEESLEKLNLNYVDGSYTSIRPQFIIH